VGGGIVWDSTSTDEYAEALLKARVLIDETPQFSLLETMLWTPEDGFFLREKHIARLMDSASYFDFPVSDGHIEEYLDQIASQFTSPQRVRLLLDTSGNLHSESKTFQLSEDHPPMRVCLAKEPIYSENVFLYHKTTHRKIYTQALSSAGAKPQRKHDTYDDVLLYNEKDELTEFTIGNLVVEINDKLYTPPISCGLLPGTFRAHLLETGQVEERIVRVEELKDCSQVFLVNSVRKWQTVIAANKGVHANR